MRYTLYLFIIFILILFIFQILFVFQQPYSPVAEEPIQQHNELVSVSPSTNVILGKPTQKMVVSENGSWNVFSEVPFYLKPVQSRFVDRHGWSGDFRLTNGSGSTYESFTTSPSNYSNDKPVTYTLYLTKPAKLTETLIFAPSLNLGPDELRDVAAEINTLSESFDNMTSTPTNHALQFTCNSKTNINSADTKSILYIKDCLGYQIQTAFYKNKNLVIQLDAYDDGTILQPGYYKLTI